MERIIQRLFSLLFFLIPLVFFPWTSEVFEFNKIILVYSFTILIAAFWIARMLVGKKIIFRRTIMDIPLLIYISANFLSSLFSIDLHTSIFGYYSRFNGGLLSLVSFSILYWAYVSNSDKNATLHSILLILLSTTIVSVYAVLEHFGHSPSCLLITGKFDVDCWVQKVSERVFATMGQPNWLAALLVCVSPLAWGKKETKFPFWWVASLLFFISLLFTKSRSGLLGFTTASVVYWTFQIRKNFKRFLLLNFSFLILALVIGTPFSPSLRQSLGRRAGLPKQQTDQTPALEGGTESGDIRKIVWKGAWQVFKSNPVLGTGPETFAFSYWKSRPVEHNNTSEWDFIYNKAHNEYLNAMANTGLVGISTYIILIGASVFQILKSKNSELKSSLFAGYTSILVTNFFGFSVVAISLLSFCLPAFAFILDRPSTPGQQSFNLKKSQKTALLALLAATAYLLFATGRYWQADFLYSRAKTLKRGNDIAGSFEKISSAVKVFPGEPVFLAELSETYATIAIALSLENDDSDSARFAQAAAASINKAGEISPGNLNILRNKADIYSDLAKIDPLYLPAALEAANALLVNAPSDPRIRYKLAILYLRIGETPKAKELLEKAIELKPDYKEAMRILQDI